MTTAKPVTPVWMMVNPVGPVLGAFSPFPDCTAFHPGYLSGSGTLGVMNYGKINRNARIEPGDVPEFFLVEVDGGAILIDNFNDGPIDPGRWRREKSR